MAAASSPTVTDSGSLISSRLISTGGSGGPGSGLGSPLISTFGGAAGAAGTTGAATAGRAGGTGAAGLAGTGGAPGRGGAAGVTRLGGAAGPAAAGGIPVRGSVGGGGVGAVGRRSVGSFLRTVGAGGAATGTES